MPSLHFHRFLALLSLSIGAGCAPGTEAAPASGAPEGRATPVRVAHPVADLLVQQVEATGTLGPRDRIPLSFSLSGTVLRVEVEAGDRVRGGDRLATLDLREIDARLRQATEAVEKAERDHDRLVRLLADGVVPAVQVDDARTAREVARAALAEARVTREYAVIRAPADGTVLERRAEAGERVQPGMPVLVVGNGWSQVFRTGLADRDRLRVGVGDRAEVRLAGLPDAPALGAVVTRLGGAADPATGTFAIEVTLDRELDLPAGVVGHLRIQPSASTDALRIPPGALLDGDRHEGSVLVLDPDGAIARVRRVTLGGLDHRGVLVTSGLAPHDRVVVEGGAWVTDGDTVRVIR